MKKTVIASTNVSRMAVPGAALGLLAKDLDRRVIERRAFEAVIWGMPAVNYDLMLQEMLDKTDGKVNEVIYWGRPLDANNQTLTPNPDAIYFMAFFNTKDGPIVLDLPAGDTNGSFNGNIVTAWQMPLEDAGLLGADKGAGGKYLILPPGHSGKTPHGYIPATIEHVRRLCPDPIEPDQSPRCRRDKVDRLRTEGKGLRAGGCEQSAGNHFHGCQGRHLRFDDSLRCELL